MTAIQSQELSRPARNSDPGSDHSHLHADHLQWFSENSMWRDDLASWQKEVDEAVARLAGVREALDKHHEKLRQHAASIRLYEQRQAVHESALARFEQGSNGQDLIEMARGHNEESMKRIHGCCAQAGSAADLSLHCLGSPVMLIRS